MVHCVITSLRIVAAAVIAIVITAPQPLSAQARATAAAEQKTALDIVIQLVTSGASDELILRQIKREHLTMTLRSDDVLRLRKAGASDRIVNAIDPLDATSAPARSSESAPNTSAPTPSASAAVPAPASANVDVRRPRRVAVQSFKFATTKSATEALFGTQDGVGDGVRSLIAMGVVQGGKVTVVERTSLDELRQERDLGGSRETKPGSGPAMGELRGADILVVGEVVTFGRDDKKKGGTIGIGPWPIGIGDLFGKEEKAVVVLSYRLVDASTGEILHSGKATGESRRKSKSIAGIFVGVPIIAGGMIDMTSSNFAKTIIGEATIDASNKIVADINERAPGLKVFRRQIDAEIAQVSDQTLTITAGSDNGVEVGDTFAVYRKGEKVVDPITSETLGERSQRIGVLTITSVDARFAVGIYIGPPVASGAGTVKRQ